ncbi:MAG: DUF2269 family protein [Mesorhizobium sp.]|nr:DUF2269 family protein [Mesorhizobium sp.]
MDWYSIVKFLHVVSAIVWLGGGFMLMLLAVRADRAGDTSGTMQAMHATGELGGKLMVPSSLLTLLSGLVMCSFWVGFSDLWIIIGLAGYTATFLVGTLIFKPTADRMAALVARDGLTPGALAEGRRIMSVARFDYTVMLIIVADMVLKPTVADIAILTAMAAVLLAGVGLTLGGLRQSGPAEA